MVFSFETILGRTNYYTSNNCPQRNLKTGRMVKERLRPWQFQLSVQFFDVMKLSSFEVELKSLLTELHFARVIGLL